MNNHPKEGKIMVIYKQKIKEKNYSYKFESLYNNRSIFFSLKVLHPLDIYIMVTNKLGALKVLIAEDNEINKLIAKTMLNQWGFSTVIAKDGEEAVMQVEQHDFDCILMDIHMPNKDGITATRDIRNMQDPSKNSLPIIALTSNTQLGVNNKYLELGMDGYLSKPFREVELYNLIEVVLENKKR